jgi:methylenetetrahydrofolate dehydrogenase (NADP+)/methenyltetrahydrofolate cyclohydrolase
MIIDGRKIADEVIAALGEKLQGKTLGVVLNDSDPASVSFVKMKERVAARVGVGIKRFSPEQIEEALLCDATIVQLPIQNAEALLSQIPPEKDVDALGLSPVVKAPVAEAVREILRISEVQPRGKKAVVVGEGKLVGKPVAELLRVLGAEVVVVSLEQGSLLELRDADIVVSGAGSPGMIKPDMLKPHVVLIDAGTSEQAGKVVGDADPACAEVVSVFTPVPGGVGPIAVAMLFRNLSTLLERAG